MKQRFNLITKIDRPYMIEVSHERREYSQKNREYCALGSSKKTASFPPGTHLEFVQLYTDNTQPDNLKDSRRYEKKVLFELNLLKTYKEV